VRLNVALLPSLLREPETNVCLVIDALRASSSIVTLFAGGVREIVLAESTAAARRIARQEPGRYLLAGERYSLPPRGFDFGNSPAEFAAADLRGHRIVLATTNGTRALRRLAPSPLVLVGALLNVSAATQALLSEAAARGLDAALVCSGIEQGTSVSLEDTFVAGAIVHRALDEARGRGIALEPADGALAAYHVYDSYQGDALACFFEAEHGRSLIAIGLGPDVEFCAQVDRFDTVPRLQREASGRLKLVAGSA
jgi:2-phosphosulfolactate phosphatase